MKGQCKQTRLTGPVDTCDYTEPGKNRISDSLLYLLHLLCSMEDPIVPDGSSYGGSYVSECKYCLLDFVPLRSNLWDAQALSKCREASKSITHEQRGYQGDPLKGNDAACSCEGSVSERYAATSCIQTHQ